MGPFAVSRVSEELQPALQPTIPMKQLPLPLAPPTHPFPSVAVDVGEQPTTEQQVCTSLYNVHLHCVSLLAFTALWASSLLLRSLQPFHCCAAGSDIPLHCPICCVSIPSQHCILLTMQHCKHAYTHSWLHSFTTGPVCMACAYGLYIMAMICKVLPWFTKYSYDV